MTWLLALVAFQLLGVAFVVRPGVGSSRRLLGAVVALMVPVAGPLLAWLVRYGRGQGTVPPSELRPAGRARVLAASVRRLSHLPPLLDRLMSPDAPERLAALVALSTAGDATAIALLRWTLDHGTTEIALDAAVALDELDLRREARRAATRRAFEEAPSFERALAAADAAADAVLNRLGDGPGLAAMAATARSAYQIALGLAPAGWDGVHERLARLELAAGFPETALDHLSRLADAPGADLTRLAELRDRAGFAARRFAGHASDG
jgi:hypothetical protein